MAAAGGAGGPVKGEAAVWSADTKRGCYGGNSFLRMPHFVCSEIFSMLEPSVALRASGASYGMRNLVTRDFKKRPELVRRVQGLRWLIPNSDPRLPLENQLNLSRLFALGHQERYEHFQDLNDPKQASAIIDILLENRADTLHEIPIPELLELLTKVHPLISDALWDVLTVEQQSAILTQLNRVSITPFIRLIGSASRILALQNHMHFDDPILLRSSLWTLVRAGSISSEMVYSFCTDCYIGSWDRFEDDYEYATADWEFHILILSKVRDPRLLGRLFEAGILRPCVGMLEEVDRLMDAHPDELARLGRVAEVLRAGGVERFRGGDNLPPGIEVTPTVMAKTQDKAFLKDNWSEYFQEDFSRVWNEERGCLTENVVHLLTVVDIHPGERFDVLRKCFQSDIRRLWDLDTLEYMPILEALENLPILREACQAEGIEITQDILFDALGPSVSIDTVEDLNKNFPDDEGRVKTIFTELVKRGIQNEQMDSLTAFAFFSNSLGEYVDCPAKAWNSGRICEMSLSMHDELKESFPNFRQYIDRDLLFTKEMIRASGLDALESAQLLRLVLMEGVETDQGEMIPALIGKMQNPSKWIDSKNIYWMMEVGMNRGFSAKFLIDLMSLVDLHEMHGSHYSPWKWLLPDLFKWSSGMSSEDSVALLQACEKYGNERENPCYISSIRGPNQEINWRQKALSLSAGMILYLHVDEETKLASLREIGKNLFSLQLSKQQDRVLSPFCDTDSLFYASRIMKQMGLEGSDSGKERLSSYYEALLEPFISFQEEYEMYPGVASLHSESALLDTSRAFVFLDPDEFPVVRRVLEIIPPHKTLEYVGRYSHSRNANPKALAILLGRLTQLKESSVIDKAVILGATTDQIVFLSALPCGGARGGAGGGDSDDEGGGCSIQ